ncbi:MAG: hypothetical protein F7B61_07340 [Caldisphaeraceae archaeon]|nr:hypothetical protein [Caldisphaeraceae archaeon]
MDRFESILSGYITIVEPTMKYPRHRELESSMEVTFSSCCEKVCKILYMLYRNINGRKICIIGPESTSTMGCDLFAGPEGGLVNTLSAGVKMLYVTSDADSSAKLLSSMHYSALIKFYHVHGDNLFRIKQLIMLDDNIVFTTQVETPYCFLPVGSFMDGDRAVAISMALGASRIEVRGFNFNRVLCYHKDACFYDKIVKLSLSRRVLAFLSKELGYGMEFKGPNIVFDAQEPSNQSL